MINLNLQNYLALETNREARLTQKQTRLAEDSNFLQTRQPLWLKYFLETKTSPTFPLFLSEHGYVVRLLRGQAICILFLDV